VALLVSAGVMMLSPLPHLLRMRDRRPQRSATDCLADPRCSCNSPDAAGPLGVEIESRVAQDTARAFTM